MRLRYTNDNSQTDFRTVLLNFQNVITHQYTSNAETLELMNRQKYEVTKNHFITKSKWNKTYFC